MTKANEIYSDTIEYLQSVKGRIAERSPFDIEQGVRIITKIVDEPSLIQSIFALTMKVVHDEDYMTPHQANTMIAVLKIGAGLNYSEKQLIELGLSALLHDVGMYVLPMDLVCKSEELTQAEIGILRTHAKHGRDLLSSFERQRPFLPDVAYQHHERQDGSGYPRGLRGADITEYAAILCLMDCYEAMTHNRPNRKALNQTFSANELTDEMKKTGFQPRIIKVFLEEITPYPMGSYVRLNNQCIGEVVATSRANPLKPDVRIHLDHLGNRVKEEQIIKLQENPVCFIEECVPAESLPEHLPSSA